MRLLVIFAALALPASSTAAPPPAPPPAAKPQLPSAGPAVSKPECKNGLNVHPADAREGLKAQRLGDLPPGNVVLTVMREVDGCNEPVIVRYGTGDLSPAPVRPLRY